MYAESFGQSENSKTKEITEKVLQGLLHHVQLKMKTNVSENKFNRVWKPKVNKLMFSVNSLV